MYVSGPKATVGGVEMRSQTETPVTTVRSTRGGGPRIIRRRQASHGGGRMTAKHRVWAGRRPAEEDPLPVDQGRVTGRDITDGGAVVDWRVSVPGVPAIVSVARRLVRAALRDSPRLGDIELIMSELVTNAIRHTPSGETGS